MIIASSSKFWLPELLFYKTVARSIISTKTTKVKTHFDQSITPFFNRVLNRSIKSMIRFVDFLTVVKFFKSFSEASSSKFWRSEWWFYRTVPISTKTTKVKTHFDQSNTPFLSQVFELVKRINDLICRLFFTVIIFFESFSEYFFLDATKVVPQQSSSFRNRYTIEWKSGSQSRRFPKRIVIVIVQQIKFGFCLRNIMCSR